MYNLIFLYLVIKIILIYSQTLLSGFENYLDLKFIFSYKKTVL